MKTADRSRDAHLTRDAQPARDSRSSRDSHPAQAPRSDGRRSSAPRSDNRSRSKSTQGETRSDTYLDADIDPTVSSIMSLGSVAAAVDPRQAPNGPEPRPRHLWLVPPRHRSPAAQRKRTRLALGAAAVGFAFVVFGLVYLHVISTEKQFTIDRLTNVQTQLGQQYQINRLAADRADSPANIMQAATRLGMVEPASVRAIKAPQGSATPASANTTPANGQQAPAGASDWPSIKPDLAGTS